MPMRRIYLLIPFLLVACAGAIPPGKEAIAKGEVSKLSSRKLIIKEKGHYTFIPLDGQARAAVASLNMGEKVTVVGRYDKPKGKKSGSQSAEIHGIMRANGTYISLE